MDPVITWVTIENHYKLWKYVPKNEWLNMIRAYPTYIKKCIKNMEAEISNLAENDECYSRLAFNEYGDNIYNEMHEEHFEFVDDYKSAVPEIDEKTVDRLNDLNDYIIDCGGIMYIAGYPIAIKEADIEEQKIAFDDFSTDLQRQLNCKVISNYSDYLFDYKYFFNTRLHMTAEGARLRTEQLVKDLRNR